MCGPSPRAEFEVDAGAEDVFVEAHNGACGASTVADGRAGAVRQVDEQIFDFGRPILCKGEFKPGADRPACFDRTVESRWGIEAGLNIAESSAASSIEENAIESVTDAPAHRSEPLALRLARDGRYYDRRNSSAGRAGIAVKVGPVAIAFDAKDILTNLVIDTSRTADKKAGSWEAAGRSNRTIRPIAVSGAKTTVDAKVNTSPIVDGHRQWWRIDLAIGRSAASAGLKAATAIAAAATSLHLMRLSLRYRVTPFLF